ncbi:hypothetical protein FGKAn22_14020 [Ferrigenium kumadai]|uniref:Uncharacterized protein n=1 Tax=Ferrigenium kumadai TaxID=1682490 RepID=A0AAN1VZR5_9PROT|nr:hypothetical protein [Ferrigenium kumadai]BBI99709.1 hypothetical protein FGKAn22_14020 [Ferrigenium kumadai]
MKQSAKIIWCGVALAWLQGATAGELAVSEQAGAIVLESVTAPADTAQGQAQAPSSAPPSAQQDQNASSSERVPIKANYEKVDRTRIEKRLSDREARTRSRSLEAEKDAAERAAKTQQ